MAAFHASESPDYILRDLEEEAFNSYSTRVIMPSIAQSVPRDQVMAGGVACPVLAHTRPSDACHAIPTSTPLCLTAGTL